MGRRWLSKWKSRFISISEASSFCAVAQNNLAAMASLATDEAQIKTPEAAVETAKVNLVFTWLTSPIYGVAGQAQLQVGDLVNASSAPVTI
jgi:multidrug resistance efflux pump